MLSHRKDTALLLDVAPAGMKAMTVSFDGKTVRSTGKMDKYGSPLHIISARLAELGITLAGVKTDNKSNEIPSVRELIGMLEVEGCIAGKRRPRLLTKSRRITC
jgi:hypothetical protein